MQTRPPVTFDPWKLATGGLALEGALALADCVRLADLLHDDAGAVRYRIEGVVDGEGRRLLHVNIAGELALVCQRCFGPRPTPLDIDVRLAPMPSDRVTPALPETYEPLVVGEDGVVLTELVEDELILALPLVPLHDKLRECEACGYVAPAAVPIPVPAEEKPNPFAALSSLLKESKDQE